MKKIFQKLKNFYFYNLKLRYKLLFSHLLLIILPTIVLSLFLYTQLYDIIVSDTILSEQTLASQTTSTIEATLTLVTQTSDSLSQSDATEDVFSSSTENLYPSSIRNRIHTLEQLAESLTDGELITDIQFYVDDSCTELLSVSGNDLLSPLSEVTSTYWYGIFSTEQSSSLFCPSLYLSVTEEEKRGDLAYITVLDTELEKEIYLAIYFSEEELNSILSDNINTENSAAYIINERDGVVASSSTALSGAYYMSNDDLLDLVGGINLYSTKSYQEDNVYVGYYTIDNTDWHLVSVLSSASLLKKGNNLVFQFVGIYILFFILALLIAISLSNSIAKRISTLVHQMSSVHHQKPERIETKQPAKDEIGELVNTYNYMSDEINDLMDQQAQTAEELKRQEFNALQAQINPHFLYNSLDMIHWLAKDGKNEEIVEAVQALSKFYKLSLSKKDSSNTIAKELEHVTLYVQIQNMRFENRITLITDVPDTLLQYEMPKLILQPLVENSIQHGILEKEDKTGTILITGWQEGEDVILLISDDGAGMSAAQLSGILSGKENNQQGGTSIGISNTHRRLELLYGTGYGLHYESTPGQGTEVQIRIPAITASAATSSAATTSSIEQKENPMEQKESSMEQKGN